MKNRLEILERQAAEIQEQQNAAVSDAGVVSQPQVVESLQVPESNPAILDESIFDFLLDMDPDSAADQILPTDSASFEIPDYPTLPNMETSFDMSIPMVSSTLSSVQVTGNPSAPTPDDADFEYDLYINQLSPEITPPKDPPNQFSQVRDKVSYGPWIPNHSWSSGKSPVKSLDNFVRLVPDANTVTKLTVRPPKSTGMPDDYAKWGPTFARGLVQHLRLDDTNENNSLVKTAIARGYNIRDVFLAGLGALDKREALQPRTGFDPSKNTLTLTPTSTLQAFLSNAVALKLPIARIKNEEYQSPFYQPEALASGNMASLEAIWNDLPKALRPTRAQITIPHHPWMDMIPFPTLRDRALTLNALNPPMIDVDDFKNDIFMNSGLFCWRVGGTSGTGQPWDMRSWEAEPWFLKKWWILVGGESGDVWEQTHWWRAMRGIPKVEMDGVSK